MAWPKGRPRGSKTGGRKKGTPNKAPCIRERLAGALESLGGQTYLEWLAQKEPRAFAQLLARTIPQESRIDASVAGPVRIEVVTGWSEGPHRR